jgi:hypothetical protein
VIEKYENSQEKEVKHGKKMSVFEGDFFIGIDIS